MIAAESRGDLLLERGVGQHVAGDCSIVNWSNGMLSLNAMITQSRQADM